MNDRQFVESVDKLIQDVMPQIGRLCIQDFANLNEVCIELSRRKRLYQTEDQQDQPKCRTCCAEANLSYGNHHALDCINKQKH